MSIYKPADKMLYGKNRGYTLEMIYKYQPSYLEWAIINIDDFCIDIATFDELKDPYVLRYEPKAFHPSKLLRRKNQKLSLDTLDEFMRDNDEINGLLDVAYLIEESQNKSLPFKTLKDFKFPEHIRAINAYKIFLATRE